MENQKKNSPLVLVLIVLIAILIIGGIVWYFASQGDTDNTNTAVTNTNITKLNTNENTNISVNTNTNENAQLDWEKYSNQSLGFSLNHPEEFTVQANSVSTVDFANYDIYDPEYEIGNPNGVKIQVFKEIFGVGRIESEQQLINELKDTKDYDSNSIVTEASEDVSIGNDITISKKTTAGPGGALTRYYAIDDEAYYSITVFEPGYTNNKDLVEQILSTFEILP